MANSGIKVEQGDLVANEHGVTSGNVGLYIDGTQVVTTQQTLDDSSGGTADGTISAVSGSGDDATINNNFKEIYDVLAAHGLVASS